MGWLGEHRDLDLSRCAKCHGARIGESANPGPRGHRRHRAPQRLEDIQVVRATTADRRASLQEFRQLLAHAQHVFPRVRNCIWPAWDLLSKWEKLEQTLHRTPMPEPVVVAMISVAIAWGWYAWACATLFCFRGCCRIGEVLSAFRGDLLTPDDLLQDDRRFYIVFREPKTRGRGARVQHATVVLDGLHARFVSATWGQLLRKDKLLPGSPAMFRNRWDKILFAFSIPPRFKLTPGSLRGWGAVAAYREGRAIADIQWSMRLQN